jgi:hypothetical protein
MEKRARNFSFLVAAANAARAFYPYSARVRCSSPMLESDTREEWPRYEWDEDGAMGGGAREERGGAARGRGTEVGRANVLCDAGKTIGAPCTFCSPAADMGPIVESTIRSRKLARTCAICLFIRPDICYGLARSVPSLAAAEGRAHFPHFHWRPVQLQLKSQLLGWPLRYSRQVVGSQPRPQKLIKAVTRAIEGSRGSIINGEGFFNDFSFFGGGPTAHWTGSASRERGGVPAMRDTAMAGAAGGGGSGDCCGYGVNQFFTCAPRIFRFNGIYGLYGRPPFRKIIASREKGNLVPALRKYLFLRHLLADGFI